MTEYNNRFVVIDVETGGLPSKLKKDATLEVALTEVAMVSVDNEKLEIGRRGSWLVKPYFDDLIYSDEACKVSGISQQMCYNEGVDIEEVFSNVQSFLVRETVKTLKPVLVIQNQSFDIPFLVNLFSLFSEDLFRYIDGVEDTMVWSRRKWPMEKKHSLDIITQRCGLEYIDAHRALSDAIMTARVWVYFMECLRGSLSSVGSGNVVKFKDNFKFS